MLNPQKKVIWKWFVGHGEDILDQPIVDSHETIIGIALDGILFGLGLDGKEKWRQQMNGAANYAQIETYTGDQYLLLIDMGGYRLKGSDTADEISLYRGNEVLKSTTFPRNAKLKVKGGRILAVVKERRNARTKEIMFD
jgi:hypothetical protein